MPTAPSEVLIPTVATKAEPSTLVETPRSAPPDLEIFELDPEVRSMKTELAKLSKEAENRHQTLLVMTRIGLCGPCNAVDASLSDPRMREALRGVRLVHVDADIFHDELPENRIPHDKLPTFAIIGVGGAPRDCIDGSEWGADTPENMAPILGAFVHGQYDKRRSKTIGCGK